MNIVDPSFGHVEEILAHAGEVKVVKHHLKSVAWCPEVYLFPLTQIVLHIVKEAAHEARVLDRQLILKRCFEFWQQFRDYWAVCPYLRCFDLKVQSIKLQRIALNPIFDRSVFIEHHSGKGFDEVFLKLDRRIARDLDEALNYFIKVLERVYFVVSV